MIRESSHRALQDLREVIGVLRAPEGELPLPGIADVPATAGRTLYRLVQERLTNVRRYAAGAPTTVRIAGGPGPGLSAEVVDERPVAASGPSGAGSGEGLRGLRERAALRGGRLEHGPTESGGWRVGMWVPWPTR
ncbi:sensor histidine kinase [Pseudonocardia oroxyli]|uniref:histidine kinase n=1 Tax=Pseudonocardia oroxyli TaxID=366584 RepID=A0A1G7XMI1_PSEOR|nr:hypothetical protein [Pseudonocardia oroxyli]SDG85372.1 hypothetical protein SAMN05216377_11628 [Pseudonocardia oroxyli]